MQPFLQLADLQWMYFWQKYIKQKIKGYSVLLSPQSGTRVIDDYMIESNDKREAK